MLNIFEMFTGPLDFFWICLTFDVLYSTIVGNFHDIRPIFKYGLCFCFSGSYMTFTMETRE